MHWGVCFSKLWLSEVAPTASILEFCFELQVELIWFSPFFCKEFFRVMKLTCRGIIEKGRICELSMLSICSKPRIHSNLQSKCCESVTSLNKVLSYKKDYDLVNK